MTENIVNWDVNLHLFDSSNETLEWCVSYIL